MLYDDGMTTAVDIDSYTAKIAKLLAQAEGKGVTEAEAEVFLKKAQELATLHSIDLAKARHLTVAKERTTPIQRTITLGVRGTRGLNTLVALFGGIARANDITYNIAHNSTYVVAFGFAEDIDVAEALYASLTVQMATAAAAYRTQGDWKDTTVFRPGHYRYVDYRTGEPTRARSYYAEREWVDSDYVPITWLSARLDFQQGFASRVGQRLAAAKREAEQQATAAEDTAGGTPEAGTALVLVEKRDAIDAFYKATSNARGSYKGGRKVANWGTYDSGRRAGDSARLSNATSLPGARKALA